MNLAAVASCLAAASILSAVSSDRPALSLPDLAGESRDIASHTDRVVVLSFWATWCVPCREEMPLLDRMQERYADRGVVVIGASADDASTRGQIEPFLESHEISFPIWTGATAHGMERFGLSTALPVTAIIDRERHVAFRLVGPLERRQLENRLNYFLSGSQGPPPERFVSHISELPGSHAD